MGSISEKNGRYSVEIRKKGINLSSTFDSRESAELWMRYKESLIDEIVSFDVPLKDVITLRSAIELRIRNIGEKSDDTLMDIKFLKTVFEHHLDKPISELTFDVLMEDFTRMSTMIVRKGGNGKDNGHARQQSLSTILRKFRCLSTVFSLMIKEGMDIDNYALRISQFIQSQVKNNKLNVS